MFRIKRYQNWPIMLKIMTIPLLSLALVALGTELVVFPKIEAWLMEQEKLKVRNVVELAYQQIAQSAEQGIPAEQAQKELVAKIKELRYGGKEYFWINDLTPRMIMHPTKPELDGTDLTEYKDPNGKHLFIEFVKICRSRGEGFVEYMWPKPNETVPAPKISYVKLYEPWGWIIGSGLYIDAFKKKLEVLHHFILAASLGFSVLLMILAWSVGQGIKRSVDEGRAFAAAVASGDLAKNLAVSREDEIGLLGSSLNAMKSDLRSLIGRIATNVHDLTETSADIAAASRNMVASADLQTKHTADAADAAGDIAKAVVKVAEDADSLNVLASESSSSIVDFAESIEAVAGNMENLVGSVDGIGASIDQLTDSIKHIDNGVRMLTETSTSTASSVHELDASIREIEAYAKASAAISEKVGSDAETGKKAVSKMIAGINDITEASRTAAEAIGVLSEKAHDIGSIVTVIDEIARQTNLLALNASIIAAQTGEHGKGFGVVAAEVKQLAERTTRSTKEIAEAIKGVQTETDRAVTAIAVAEESIRTGESLSLEAGDALTKIVDGVERTSVQMAEIAIATKEQARESEHIRAAMENVSSMANDIADRTLEQRKASELIHNEVGRVRAFSAVVMKSMKEQARVSELITRMAKQVSESGSGISRACRDKAEESLRIGRMVEDIHRSTKAVLKETQVVDKGLTKLRANTEALQQEVETFRL